MTPRSGAVRQKKDCPFVAVQEKRKTKEARPTERSGAVRQKKDCPFVAVLFLARHKELESLTFGSVDQRSIQLS